MADKEVVSLDFALLPGDAIEDKLSHAIKTTPVLVFGKESCPFCLEVKRTLESLNVPYSLYNVDVIADGPKVHQALKAKEGQATVPYVYIGGELIGGCDATKAAQSDGSLFKKLAKVNIHAKGAGGPGAGSALLEDTKRPLSTLFYFPEVVDDRVARFNGVWGSIICLLVAVFFWTPQAQWTMGGLMIDYMLRFIGGGNITPIGCLSGLCVAVMEMFGSKPTWVAGQSKQFATLCGFTFAFLSFFFYMVSIHNEKLLIVGLAFTCGLGGATGLEGWAGWCMGCWMFGLLIKFGILPQDTFMLYTNIRDEADYTWEDMNKRLNEGEPPYHRRTILPDGTKTVIDFTYKAKTDDMTREDWNIIKHVKITHFLAHMGIAGLACAWNIAAPYSALYAPTPVQYAIALLAAVLFVIWLGLYFGKCMLYPQRVIKEWQHPTAGNAFAVPFITSMLFAFLVQEHTNGFAQVLFWIGAPITMGFSMNAISKWISYRKDIEHLNASWMIMPVGNAVAAMVGPVVEGKNTNACQFWWAVALIGWAILFAATLLKTIFVTEEDDRNRPFLAIWVAAPSVLAVSYLAVYPYVAVVTTSGTTVFNDFIFINLHWISVGVFLILLACFRTHYLGRIKFDMAYWAAGFPASALAFSSIVYNVMKPGNLSYGISIAALAFATCVNLVLCINTLTALLRRRVFVPDQKWAPLSFMRLTHEALRGGVKRMINQAELMSTSSNITKEMIDDVAQSWSMMELLHDEHSKHEDQVIFKLYDEFYPGIAKDFNAQHTHHHDVMKTIDDLLTTLSKTPSPEAAKELMNAFNAYAKELEEHLRGEEDHLIGMPRKHINLALHKQTVRKCFELTSSVNWYKLMPYVINNLPMLHQRVRFLKTMLWAMPERAQHFGMMVGLGVDAIQWRRITDELPEIIPRGAYNYKRYY